METANFTIKEQKDIIAYNSEWKAIKIAEVKFLEKIDDEILGY